MSAPSPVICLEFNELTPSLMEKFINKGKLPNFQRLREQSLVRTTDAQADGEWLNPWVQWVTIHSGLSAEQHGVFRLSNAYKLESPAVWDIVSEHGDPVWICGSMNPWYRNDLKGYVLPDAWSQQVSPYPKGEFDSFYSFIQRNVQEYAASKVPLSKSDIYRFLKYLVGHGLKATTAIEIVSQLIKERIGNHRWRRASILDSLQYDVFEHYYKKTQPKFSTFFINSTAHYQHKFWRNMEPEAFQIRPTASEQRDYGDAILFGYQEMDRIVGRVMKLAPEATIMLLTGLGQQPYTKMETEGGKRVFRLHNKSVLVDKLGIAGNFKYEPIMADEFFLRFETVEEAAACVEKLQAYRLPSGKEAFKTELNGVEIVAQCRCRELPADDAVLTFNGSDVRVPFHDAFYRVDCVKSGYHHPHGIWWIRTPQRVHDVSLEPVPLVNVAPTILSTMGIEVPDFMSGQPLGQQEGATTQKPSTTAVSSAN